MASGASEITLGPFLGGLNNATGVADTIADNELYTCVDFDYTVDGTLVTRPAVFRMTSSAVVDTKQLRILGVLITSSNSYTLACVNNTDLVYRDNSGTITSAGWTAVSGGAGFGNAMDAVQYGDKLWIVKTTAGGASWSIAAGFSAVGTIPAGTAVEVFKERLWVASGTLASRLSFSNVGVPGTWSASDFIDVGPGDGQVMQTIVAGVNSLYIFKDSSTWVLSFDSDPARGSLQAISETIGAISPQAVTQHENIIYVLDLQYMYAVNGYTYTRVNVKVDINRENTDVATLVDKGVLSTVGDRILVQFKNKTYVYYPLTRTWTEWAIPPTGKWFGIEQYTRTKGYTLYYAGLNTSTPGAGSAPLLALYDGPWDAAVPVDYVQADPTIVTKMFSFDTPSAFKRLMWWGADVIATSSSGSTSIFMSLIPYNFSGKKTWGELALIPWNVLDDFTWAQQTEIGGAVDNTVIIDAPLRKYIKAQRSIRFTRVQFKVSFPNFNHTATSSIHHLVVAIKKKQSPQSKSEGALQ
jgi:hypothetical protein